MKFKLVEKFDETRSVVQDYMYDAIDELNNASLEEYIQWFKSELTYYDETLEQAVTDAYIEACDYGMIKGVEKTRLTSELKEYIESHADIIDDTDELMRQCPEHLQHELKIVLSKLDESLNEELLTEEKLYRIGVDNKEFFFIAGNKQNFQSIADIITYLKLQRRSSHESIDWNLLNELESYIEYPYSLEDYDNRINVDDSRLSRLINKTFSTTRKRSRRNFIQKISSAVPQEMINNILIHHVDGNELNEEDTNLIGLFDNNLHQLLHNLKLVKYGTTYSWEGKLPVLVYNGVKYIPKLINIKLDV